MEQIYYVPFEKKGRKRRKKKYYEEINMKINFKRHTVGIT